MYRTIENRIKANEAMLKEIQGADGDVEYLTELQQEKSRLLIESILLKDMTGKAVLFEETLAEIAYQAGAANFYPKAEEMGGSMGAIRMFMEWAEEFEEKYEGVNWGIDEEYNGEPISDWIDMLGIFITGKLQEYGE